RAFDTLKAGCVVDNISEGGLMVRTDEPLAVGTPLVLDLVKAGMRKAIRVTGRVVGQVGRGAEVKPGGAGLRIQFDPVGGEAGARLSELLQELGVSDPKKPTLPPNLFDDEPLGPVSPSPVASAPTPPPI